MKTRVVRRCLLAVGMVFTTVGVTGPAVLRPPVASAAEVPVLGPILDELADLFQDDNAKVDPPGEADVVAASGEYKADGIVLNVKVQKPSDPLKDRNWRSEETYISWYLDTNGDGEEDYEAVYFLDSGKLGGEVFATRDDDKALCELAAATFDAAGGYTAVIPPKCIGDPKAVSYQLQFNYQSDPKDDTTLAWDLAPDDDYSAPLTIGGSVTPMGAAPTPTTSAAPSGGTSPSTSAAPTTATSTPATKPPAVKAPSATTKAPPSGVAGQNSSAPRPAAGDGVAAPTLARTGLGDKVLRMAAFAVGIALIGIGLLFANRRTSLG